MKKIILILALAAISISVVKAQTWYCNREGPCSGNTCYYSGCTACPIYAGTCIFHAGLGCGCNIIGK